MTHFRSGTSLSSFLAPVLVSRRIASRVAPLHCTPRHQPATTLSPPPGAPLCHLSILSAPWPPFPLLHMKTSSPMCHATTDLFVELMLTPLPRPGPSQPALHAANTASVASCAFCGISGHSEPQCFAKHNASNRAKQRPPQRTQRRSRRPTQPQRDQDTPPHPVTSAGCTSSLLAASDRSSWLSSPAATKWNTDTGASAHMTPHRHWFRSYSPHTIPIRLANSHIVYSAGLGSVVFQPESKGGTLPPAVVLHDDVLHVPDLASNLLSVYHLTRENVMTALPAPYCFPFPYCSMPFILTCSATLSRALPFTVLLVMLLFLAPIVFPCI